MFSALKNALTALIKKPWLILPALVVSIIAIVVEILTMETKFLLLFDLFFAEKIPKVSLIEMPFRFIELYPTETAMILGGFALIVLLNIFVFIIYARFVKQEKEEKKASLVQAIRYASSQLGQAILLFIVLSLIVLFFAVLYFLLIALIPITSFTWILFIILFLLFIYLFIRFLFIVPALVDSEKAKAYGKKVKKASGGIKEAFGKSWGFTQKHLFGTILLLIILAFINLIAGIAIGTIAENIEITEFSIGVFYVLLAIIATFSNLSICYYYFEKK